MATKSRLLANKKFREKAYDVITFEADKGKKNIYKAGAAELGMSLRCLIQYGVEEFIARHSGKEFILDNQQVAESEKLSADQKKLVENFSRLPKKTQKYFANLIEDYASQPTKGGD